MAFVVAKSESERKVKQLAEVLNDNAGWIRHVCGLLYRFSKSFEWCLEPFIEEPPYAKIIIPYKPNISLHCTEEDYDPGEMKCEFSIGNDNKVTVFFTRSGVKVVDEDRSGIVSGFLIRLATDQEVFREILKNYYNITRAAAIVAQENEDDEHLQENIDDIYSTMSMVEDAYINTYGESITADEETVQKLARLYGRVRAAGYTMLNAIHQLEPETTDVNEVFIYSDYFRIDNDTSMYIDISINYNRTMLDIYMFDSKTNIMKLSIDANEEEQYIETLIDLKCFGCLDYVLTQLVHVERLAGGITRLFRSLERAIHRHMLPKEPKAPHLEQNPSEDDIKQLIKEVNELADEFENRFRARSHGAAEAGALGWLDVMRGHQAARWLHKEIDDGGMVCLCYRRSDEYVETHAIYSDVCVSDGGVSIFHELSNDETAIRLNIDIKDDQLYDKDITYDESKLASMTMADIHVFMSLLKSIVDGKPLEKAFREIRQQVNDILLKPQDRKHETKAGQTA